MAYSKCGLCLQDLEVVKPASGIPYIRSVNWKECPFFCPEESINGYQLCVRDQVIPDYIACEGGKQLNCKHKEVPTLRISRSQKNPFRPYFTCRRKEMCRYFQWADEMPIEISGPREPQYHPREALDVDMPKKDQCKLFQPRGDLEVDMLKQDQYKLFRPKLQRQFARVDSGVVSDSM